MQSFATFSNPFDDAMKYESKGLSTSGFLLLHEKIIQVGLLAVCWIFFNFALFIVLEHRAMLSL
jgi:hypothetical protein